MDTRKEETGRQSAGQQGGHRERSAGLQSPEAQAGGRAAGTRTWASEPGDTGVPQPEHTQLSTHRTQKQGPDSERTTAPQDAGRLAGTRVQIPGRATCPRIPARLSPTCRRKTAGSRTLMAPALRSRGRTWGQQHDLHGRGGAQQDGKGDRRHGHRAPGDVLMEACWAGPCPHRACRPGTGRPHTVPSEKPRGWEG